MCECVYVNSYVSVEQVATYKAFSVKAHCGPCILTIMSNSVIFGLHKIVYFVQLYCRTTRLSDYGFLRLGFVWRKESKSFLEISA